MKIKRNALCPCGSGEKFKKCCIGSAEYNPTQSTNIVPRKYMCEFGLHTWSSRASICYPNMLDTVDVSNANYHIYMINKITRLTFIIDSLKIYEDYIEFQIKRGVTSAIEIETIQMPNFPQASSWEFESDKILMMHDGEGGGIRFDILWIYVEFANKYLDCEILYVGQAYGKKGERDALTRLKSHETLQKVLADMSYNEINYEVAITLWELTPRLQTSMDGRSDFVVSEEEDKKHLMKVLSAPPLILDNQMINVTEAALINYFKPKYNTMFVNNFPDVAHKGYKFYYDYDYNSIIVELDNTCININVFSQERDYSCWKAIKYPLNSEEERRSMFEI